MTKGIIIFYVIAFVIKAHASPQINLYFTQKEALEILKSHSPRWTQAQEGIQEASAKLLQAKSARLPHISFGLREFAGRINLLQYGFTSPGDLNFFTFGSTTLIAGYEILNSPANLRLEAAEQNVSSANSHLKSNQIDLIFYALILYTQLQRWENLAHNRSKNLENMEQLKNLAKQKWKSELGISLDYKRAEARQAMGKIKLLEAQSNASKTRNELATLLGIPSIDRPVISIEKEILFPSVSTRSPNSRT
jgi:outer membrane protein TolC